MAPWKLLLWLAGGAAIVFWADICAWFAHHVNPWLKRHCPWLQPYLEQAFMFIDQNVATPIRRAVLAAWEAVRPYVLRAVITFERRFDGAWVRRMTSWLRSHLERSQVVERVEETIIDWADLPDEVRAAIMRTGAAPVLDVVEARDQYLLELEESN